MGHLTTISAGLQQTASADPAVDKLLSEIPEWLEYVKGPLAQIRERESRRLADYMAAGTEDMQIYEDDDKDNLQQYHYSGFTNNFTDDFNEEPEENDEFDNDYQNDRDVRDSILSGY
jgi:hypothetical protein